MNISEALSSTKPLAVRFGNAVLNVDYRPPSYTIEQMVAAESDKGNPERLIKMLQDLVQGWDLTRTEMRVLEPNGDPVPVELPVDITNADDVRRFVPQNIIMGIVKAVRDDNDPSGE